MERCNRGVRNKKVQVYPTPRTCTRVNTNKAQIPKTAKPQINKNKKFSNQH
eukprot:m.27025 g.27025  ORF g.27025 m.27025 type:complete len:51 (-) comp15642_c0_seq1:468-620(-)